MSKIHLGTANGADVFIDIPVLLTTRLLVTASSGGGKTETLRRILEEACGHVQCIVIDPEGEFSTLRERFPFVLVGEGGETTADVRTAALVARRLLELNVSAVCDIYELSINDRHEWVRRFLDAMVHSPKALWHPVIIIVDEAHTFCPEQGYSKSVASQAVIDLANLGRKRGFCPVLATQRLSKLDKNAVEPLQNYLLGLTMYDDQERAAKTFKVPKGKPTAEFSLMLERLNPGGFICRGRAFLCPDMAKIQVSRPTTRPPATGTAMAGVTTPTPEAIRALLPKLADLPKEAERQAQTEEDLRQEIARLRREIAQRPANQEQIDALNQQVASLENWSRGVARAADGRKHAMDEVAERLSELVTQLRLVAGDEKLEAPANLYVPFDNANFLDRPVLSVQQKIPVGEAAARLQTRLASTDKVAESSGAPGELNLPKRRILDAIATFRAANVPARVEHIAAFCGTTRRARGFEENIRQLRASGFVTVSDGILHTDGNIGTPAPMATGLEALRTVLSEPQFRMLHLVKSKPGIDDESLANFMSTTVRARGFEENLRRLRADALLTGSKNSLRVADWIGAMRHF